MSESVEMEEPLYQHATVVILTMDDPNSDLQENDVLIRAGLVEDGVSHTIIDETDEFDSDFVDIECERLGIFRAGSEMTEDDITSWAVQIARRLDFMNRVHHPRLDDA